MLTLIKAGHNMLKFLPKIRLDMLINVMLTKKHMLLDSYEFQFFNI